VAGEYEGSGSPPYFGWGKLCPLPEKKFLNCGVKMQAFMHFLLQKKLLATRKLDLGD